MLEIVLHIFMFMAAVVAIALVALAWLFMAAAVAGETDAIFEEALENARTIRFFNKIEEFRNDFA